MSQDHRPPALPLLAREVVSFAAMRTTARFGSAVMLPKTREKRLIMVIPGFMATDGTTARLRRSLARAGHEPHGWGLGRNQGVSIDMLEQLDRQIKPLRNAVSDNALITLIGWSLGGLVAREYAKFAPDNVQTVITLGSPFSGDIRGNNAWRVYEAVARHKVDNPPIDTDLRAKPPVPTYAFWSRGDGVVSPASARGEIGETDEHFEIDCTHMAFVSKPSAIRAIADLIDRN